MRRGKQKKQPQIVISVNLDKDTKRMVKAWYRKGLNISELVRFCMKRTFPVIYNPADQIRNLEEARAFKCERFDKYRRQFERELAKINLEIRKLRKDMEENQKAGMK